ncbi:spore cortex-lytic enzyme [Bacillus gaemokensis]|uniref:Spore cortex-lytic enzyme n=1 Tax=Bacillus gaemokensis TaxID=574375 RepID=A0A073K881_9BACI|nr:spore cortex-lytic enzyme [Bacillus gaemokensis]KEK22780.1 hydrolase [Bacillus gaemokensis]KYG36805.1 spore cortex-lytic enzyme [Bacillus gaemokensis]
MRQKGMFKVPILLVLIGLSLIVSSGQTKNVQAFSNQVIQKGAFGEDVIELQSRLKYNGYYKGKVDAVFGWGTYWALRNFQQNFGLRVDGLAGPKTKQMLVKATKYEKLTANKGNKGNSGRQSNKATQRTATNVPNGYSQNDIRLMANAVYGEARGEPYLGQVAVAAVILNRVTSASFPNTVSKVIYEPRAFTAVADGQINLTPNETAKKAVLDAINGWDPTGNALYYFNPDTATSKWIWSRPQIKKIGKHIFCK